MEPELWDYEVSEHQFAKDIGKTFVLSAVGVIGMAAGMVVVGAISKFLRARTEQATEDHSNN